MQFKDRIILCDPGDELKVIDEYLEKWISSLLIRSKVDKSKIEAALHSASFSKKSWRTELFFKHGIEIIKHIDKVVITKHFEDRASLVLGQWNNPEIIRVKEDGEKYCKIILNYWQIV